MTRARLCHVWPEEQEQLITAAATLASRGKDSEQRQSAALLSMLAQDRVVLRADERQGAERPKAMAMS